ncbi:MAG: twin-arginine translocase subunit TatC [Desulfocapsaceae bacterium]
MNDAQGNFEDQPLTEHLRELRSCLIYSFAAIFIGFCLSYVVIRPIGTWFFKPLTEVLPEGTSLIFTSYQEGFFFLSKTCSGLRCHSCQPDDILSDLEVHWPRSVSS